MVGRTGINAYSSGRLPGDLQATTSATLDDNPATVWQPGLGSAAQVGTTLTYDLKAATTLTHLSLGVVADGRHSVPTSLTISAGGSGQSRSVSLPAIADSAVPGAVTTIPLSFPALRGQQFVITFTGVRTEMAANYYSAGPLALPLGIATVSGFPGAPVPVTPAALPGNCTAGLLSIDGDPIDVAVVGATAKALDNDEVQVVPCGPDAKGIRLAAGTHVLQTAPGHSPTTGWNIDQLVLDSAPGGGAGVAATVTPSGEPSLAATQAGSAPTVTVQSVHIDTETAKVTGATAGSPFELVLGQSVNSGWRAVASPGPGAPAGAHSVDLGTPQLIDSFANGWAVTRSDLRAVEGRRVRARARSSSAWTGRPSARCGSRSCCRGRRWRCAWCWGSCPSGSGGGCGGGGGPCGGGCGCGGGVRGRRRRQGRQGRPWRPSPSWRSTTINPNSTSSAVSHPTGCGGGTSSSSAW